MTHRTCVNCGAEVTGPNNEGSHDNPSTCIGHLQRKIGQLTDERDAPLPRLVDGARVEVLQGYWQGGSGAGNRFGEVLRHDGGVCDWYAVRMDADGAATSREIMRRHLRPVPLEKPAPEELPTPERDELRPTYVIKNPNPRMLPPDKRVPFYLTLRNGSTTWTTRQQEALRFVDLELAKHVRYDSLSRPELKIVRIVARRSPKVAPEAAKAPGGPVVAPKSVGEAHEGTTGPLTPIALQAGGRDPMSARGYRFVGAYYAGGEVVTVGDWVYMPRYPNLPAEMPDDHATMREVVGMRYGQIIYRWAYEDVRRSKGGELLQGVEPHRYRLITREIATPARVKCPTCGGTGHEPGSEGDADCQRPGCEGGTVLAADLEAVRGDG